MTDDEAIQSAKTVQNPNLNTSVSPPPKEVEEWLKSQPLSQFSLILVRDPAFRGAMSEINQKYQKNALLGYEAIWILLIWIFRSWRLTKAGTWLTRIWVQAWVSMIFWWGFLFLVPWLLWGKSYQMVLATVFRALIHQFWA